MAGAQRMVIGHSPQLEKKITVRCDGKLVLIDTVISVAYRPLFGYTQPSIVEFVRDSTGKQSIIPHYFNSATVVSSGGNSNTNAALSAVAGMGVPNAAGVLSPANGGGAVDLAGASPAGPFGRFQKARKKGSTILKPRFTNFVRTMPFHVKLRRRNGGVSLKSIRSNERLSVAIFAMGILNDFSFHIATALLQHGWDVSLLARQSNGYKFEGSISYVPVTSTEPSRFTDDAEVAYRGFLHDSGESRAAAPSLVLVFELDGFRFVERLRQVGLLAHAIPAGIFFSRFDGDRDSPIRQTSGNTVVKSADFILCASEDDASRISQVRHRQDVQEIVLPLSHTFPQAYASDHAIPIRFGGQHTLRFDVQNPSHGFFFVCINATIQHYKRPAGSGLEHDTL